MDVTSLFPSLKTESTAKEIKETVMESDIMVRDVNWRCLAIFLRKNMTTSGIIACNFCDFIPTQKKRSKDHKGKVHDSELWNFNNDIPAESVIRSMLAEAIAITCRLIMNNHMYKFGDSYHVQENEGSIGVKFTGIASEIKMLKWCQKLKTKLQKLKIVNHLHSKAMKKQYYSTYQ